MDWQIIYIIFSLNLVAVTSGLAFFAWRRREKKGAVTFAALMVSVAVSALPYAAELASSSLDAIIFWNKVEYFGLVAMPVIWLAFAFDYTGNQRWLKWHYFLLLSLIPALTLLLVLTNEQHNLIWTDVGVDRDGGFPRFAPEHGFGFWLFMSYAGVILLFGSMVLLRKAISTWRLFRRQAIAIFLGSLFPWVGILLTLTGLNPLPEFNPVVVFFNLGAVCFAWAVFRLSMLDIIPVSYEDVIESLPDGVMTVDTTNRVTAFNTVLSPYLNLPPDKIIAAPVEQIFENYLPQYRYLLKDKEARAEIELENRTIELRISPLYNRRKQFMGRLLLFRDVTHRKRAETALNQRLEHLNILREAYEEIGSTLNLDKILSLAVDAAVRLSKSSAGYIVLIDQEEMQIAASMGYGEVSNHRLILQADSAILRRAANRRRPARIMDIFRETDYSPFLFDTRAKLVMPLISQNTLIGVMNLETGNPVNYSEEIYGFIQILASHIAAAIDNAHLHLSLQNRLGEVHQLYQKLSSLEQLKTDMIRMAAHDLRNPLGVIANALEMLADEQVNEELREIYFQPMQNAADRISRISADILSLERIEAMATGVNMQLVNLCEQVQQAVEEYNPRARRKSLHLRLIMADEVYVRGDTLQLYEAMVNLLSNAIKYTPEGGEIKITLKKQNYQVIFQIEDTGYGIPDDDKTRLFQPFFRVKTYETMDIDGTGLGLHLVKNIIDRHGGKVIFESRYGQGSIFGFSLPDASPD